MKNYLSEKEYEQFLKTYSIAEIESIWNSVFEMCDWFQVIAAELSEKEKFVYDDKLAENSLSYLNHIRKLPPDAKEIY